VNPDINIYIVVNSYLLRCSLTSLATEEFGNVTLVTPITNTDQLLSLLEKSKGCFIVEDNLLNTLPAGYTIPQFADIICIGENAVNLKEKARIKEWINIDDKKHDIIQKIKNVLSPENNNSSPDNALSEREKDVIRLVAKGLTNKEIADILNLSIHTIITHRKNITGKLGIKTISGLSIYALLNGIIQPDEAVI
jgi:DNA-binding CsgD family transcriptional regulator